MNSGRPWRKNSGTMRPSGWRRMKVIAEGVETEEQSKFLRLLRCEQFQCYLFRKPVPAEQVPALLVKP